MKFRRMFSFRISLLIFALLWSIFSPRYCISSAQKLVKSEEPSSIKIRLDYRPFQNLISKYITLRDDGKLRAIYYRPYERTVVHGSEMDLTESEVGILSIAASNPVFKEAMQYKNFAGDGITRGNQFFLFLETPIGTSGECYGFIDNAPSEIQSFVELLLTKIRNLPKFSIAAAYARSERISNKRFEKLKKRGKVRFRTIDDFPSEIQNILKIAINYPRDFTPMSQENFKQILDIVSNSHDLFLISSDSGHQLTFFKTKNTASSETQRGQKGGE